MIDKHADDFSHTKFTLDQLLTYQIKFSGQSSENWEDWIDKMDVQIETEPSGFSTTTLTVTVDQAALIGLLRQLYYLGFPLISVNCIQLHEKKNN